MATSGDGMAPYQGGGAGGKFRKRPIRRNAQGTPYDRPPTALRNNSPSLFAKLVDPASRLIYAGADRLFGVFRKRLPAIAAPRPPETSEEPRNRIQEAGPNICTEVSEPSTDEGRYLSTISAATQISELENMLKQKTFTRSEIERLTALLHSRTTESPSDDVNEGDREKLPSTTSQLLRLEASTSGTLNKHVEDREFFHATISTLTNSRVFEEDVASPAELAKAYMGTRPAKVSPLTLRLGSQTPRQELLSLNNTTVLSRTPITSLASRTAGSSKGYENGLTTPRSRGRSAIYNMARTPYYRGTSTLNQKGMKSDYGHGVASPSLALSQPVWEHDGPSGTSKMALKRRSSVLDDIGSGGPVRRIRQKANLLSQGSSLSKHKSEFGSSVFQQPGASSQKLLLRNEPEPKVSKTVEEKGESSRRNLGYASVPTKSSQMASKILEQLERLSPKEKPSGSRLAGTNEKSPTKQTSTMIHGQEKVDSPKFLSRPSINQKSEGQHNTWLSDARESTSLSNDKVEENGPRKFAVPRNVLSSMNGSSTVPVRDNAPIVANTDSILKMPAEPPQKKRSFQMSAHEDSFELDDNHSNGHAFIPVGENKKPGTSLVAKKDVSADAPAEVNQIPALPEVSKIPSMPKFKITDDAISPPKTDFGPPGGSIVKEQKMGFNFPTSSPSSSNTSSAVFSQSTSVLDSVAPQKEPTVLPTFGTSTKNAEKVPSFLFSANESPGFKTNAIPDAKPPGLTSSNDSFTKNDQVQVPASNKDDNGNIQKSVFMFGKSESLSSASPTVTSASGIFSFGGSAKNSSIANGIAASSPSTFASSSPFPAFGTNTNKPFSSSSSSPVPSSGTTTGFLSSSITTNSASTVAFSTPEPSPAPIFGFGSAITSTTSALVAPTKDKEPKSNTSSSPFAIPSFATASTGSAFGFSSPAATTTTNNLSQESLFKGTSGSQASTAVTQAVPFQFGSSSTSPVSGTTAIPSSGSSLFGSSAPAFSSAPSFGLSSAVATTEIKSGSSTTNIFGSTAFSSTPSFGLGSAVASSETKFGSSWQPPKSSAFGSSLGSPSTGFSFGASSASSSPIVFGSTSNASASTGSSMFSFTASGGANSSFPAPSSGQSLFGNSTPVFEAAATASPNNNDQMSMEDSMAEDSTTQTPTPSIPTFGQAPGFMFGSATPTQSPVPFQFGGQTNQPPSQNPFQASGGQTNQPPSQNPFQASGSQANQPSQNSFQASGSVEFNAGGSFSLGSGGGDKSGRRIVRVNKSKNRRK